VFVAIGTDTRGRNLEVGFVIEGDVVTVLHVMPVRRRVPEMAITEKQAAALADKIERGEIDLGESLPREQWPEFMRGRGRPSLGRARGKSPQVTIRIPAELRERAEARAKSEQTTVSAVARSALEAYLA
jgi:hypothetical protein